MVQQNVIIPGILGVNLDKNCHATFCTVNFKGALHCPKPTTNFYPSSSDDMPTIIIHRTWLLWFKNLFQTTPDQDIWYMSSLHTSESPCCFCLNAFNLSFLRRASAESCPTVAILTFGRIVGNIVEEFFLPKNWENLAISIKY